VSNPNRVQQVTVANAETNARLEPISGVGSPGPQPLVSGVLAAVAGVVAVALPLAAPFLPPPFSGLAVVLAFVAAFLAGVPVKPPALVASKPVVGQALVPALGGLVPVLAQVSQSLTGTAQAVVYGVALLVAWLAGVAMPQPKK
jgi:hypothetical protein